MNIEDKLNDFATRSFRDIADQDYISARLAYRYSLIPQFHWQSLQAIEKYFKSIFLYNRIKAKNINHDLDEALNKLNELPFNIDLTDTSLNFIKHLSKFGKFRYLEISYYIYGPKLAELDKTVWDIRRYCQVINYDKLMKDGVVRNMLTYELTRIKESESKNFNEYRIPGGELETILDDTSSPSRPALIWQNAFFSKKNRKKVKIPTPGIAINSPLSMHPEMIEEVMKYVHLPKYLENAYKELLNNR